MNASFLLEQDMFGTPVTLKFGKRGDSINTYSGALVTLVIKAFMTWFLVDRCIVLFSNSNNNIGYESSYTDFEALGSVEIAGSGFLLILQKWRKNGDTGTNIDEAIIDFENQYKSVNWVAA